jgi:hypothetical protein
MFVLSPLTGWLGRWHRSAGAPLHSFLHEYKHYITGGYFISGFGPLWFCVVLFLFCCIYAAGRETGFEFRPAAEFPGDRAICAFIGILAVCTFLIRVYCPIGTAYFNLQFGYFPQYIGFFVAGLLAWRQQWLVRLPAAMGKRWGLFAVLVAPLAWIALSMATGAGKASPAVFLGGWHWQSLAIALLEAVAGVGISLGMILLFRERFNVQGRVAAFLSANYFSVYVFHATILVAITRLLFVWHAPALLKFAVAAAAAVVITYILSATVFRRIPILKKIL